ncbi:MAG TPA: hypothetical protein ENN40_11870 [Candidatus Aminicenantes bacterium]|nr:hypothetical protein [Candidatus Aminicenantes bacterium]
MRNRFRVPPALWAFTTYFTEGFPFTLIRTVSSVFFRDMRVSLENIGLTSLFGLPWILKFLWAPQVDAVATKRRWLLSMQGMLLAVVILAAVFAPLEFGVRAVAALFFVGSILAATHDIAIDGYYMEALDKNSQARWVGYRVMAYRIAMMTGTGVVVTLGTTTGWGTAFAAAAVIFGIFFVFHLFFLAEVEAPKRAPADWLISLLRPRTLALVALFTGGILGVRAFFLSPAWQNLQGRLPWLRRIYFSHWIALLLLLALIGVGLFRRPLKRRLLSERDSHFSRAFVSFMDRERVGRILGFIILMRTGEWALSTMVAPFVVDLGIKAHYGWISAWVGLPASIAGALIGGWAISRYGMRRLIWPFLLAQNLTNLIYMGAALHLAPFITPGGMESTWLGTGNLALFAGIHGFDQLAGGLGTAVLMTYLMRICSQGFKAAHYAIGSGLMNLGGLFAGVASGFIAGWLGYAWLFGFSFVLSVPAMLLIPGLPYLETKVEELKS